MADGTVTGEFRLYSVQARRELERLKREGRETDRTMEKLGRDLDTVGSRKQATQVRRYRVEVRNLGTDSRSADREVVKLRRDVERLEKAASAAASGRRGGGGGAGVRGGIFGLSGGMKLMAAQATVALPAVRALTGGVLSLGAAVASAAGGAGAVGAAGLGGLLVGLGGIASVAMPASKAIKEAADAQKKYNQAVREYGRASKEAGEARGEARLAFRNAPRGTRSLVNEANTFAAAWKRATRTGQESLVGFLREVVATGRKMRGPLAEIANQVTKSFAFQGRQGLRFLQGRGVRAGLRAGGGIFSENLGNVRRIGQATVTMFLNVTRAARPFVKEFTTFSREFFERQASRTRNIGNLRKSIGGMVDDLKSVGKLGGAGGRLIMAIFGGGAARQEGRGLIGSATKQLQGYTNWINQNPEKVRQFFRETAQGMRDIASAGAALAKMLADLSRDLGPVLRGLTTLAGLAGQLGGVGTIGLGSALLGAGRGARGKPGGPGVLGTLLGLGGRGGRGAAAAAKPFGGASAAALTGGAAATRAGGLARVGGLAKGAAMGAGKAFWPIALAMGGLGFAGTEGSVGRRLQGAASMVIPGVKTPRAFSEIEAAGREQAAGFVGAGPGVENLTRARAGYGRTTTEIERLRGRLGETRTLRGMGGPVQVQAIQGDERRQVEARIQGLKDEQRARAGVIGELENERDARNREVSRQRAGRYAGEIQQGFARRRRRGATPQQAAAGARRSTVQQIQGMNPAGAMDLSQETVTWLDKLRRDNPALQGEYDKLTEGIERKFRRLGRTVRVVQGRILTGTKTQMGNVADQMASQARRGVDAASAEFRRLNQIARAELELMGFSGGQASSIVKGLRSKSKAARSVARADVKGGLSPTQAAATDRNVGDGPGDDRIRPGRSGIQQAQRQTTGTNTPSRAQTGSLMGASPGLGVYATDAAGYGLMVSSGLRQGAITSSGNRSFHASGNALDLSGPTDKMMAFAQHAASAYGSDLEELIHTPLGAGQIKNGQPFTYTGQVAADHYDHVHIADTAPPSVLGGARGAVPAAGGAGAARTVRARRSGLPGVIGAMADRATASVAAGLNQRLASVAGGTAGLAAGTGGGGSNREIGKRMMVAAGWPESEWGALDQLWTGESNWSSTVMNKSSGATGIPQALPGSKMASAGPDWRTNPETQIAWGLDYIRGRYGSPSGALSAWQARSPHWYGRGGSGIYRKGALIGVGDSQPSGGSEQVTVRRLRPGQQANENAAGGGGIHVSIQMTNVRIGSAAEARGIAQSLGEEVARKIASALREAPMTAAA